ncbi:unnamed protein product [Ixodes hexagonus]
MAESTIFQGYKGTEPAADTGTPSREYELDVASASSPVLARALSDAIVRSIVESDEWPSFVEELRKVGDDDDFDDLPYKPTSKPYASWITGHLHSEKGNDAFQNKNIPEAIPEDKTRSTLIEKDSALNRLQGDGSSVRASADPAGNDDAFRQTDKNCRLVRTPRSEARCSRALYSRSRSGNQQSARVSSSGQIFPSGKRASGTSPPFKRSRSSLPSAANSPVSDEPSPEWSDHVEQFRAALLSSGSSGDCDLAKSAFHITDSGSSILALEELFRAADQARRLHDDSPFPVAAGVRSLSKSKRPAKELTDEGHSVAGGTRRSLRRLGRGAFGRVFGVQIKGAFLRPRGARALPGHCWSSASSVITVIGHSCTQAFTVLKPMPGPRRLPAIARFGSHGFESTFRACFLYMCVCNIIRLWHTQRPSSIHGCPLLHGRLPRSSWLYLCSTSSWTQVCGTVQYMAPEVLCGQRPDFASDVYSLGVVLWQMQSGVRPFDGLHQHAVIFQVVRQQARPQFVQTGVPPELEALVTRCWSTFPQERPSIGAVVRDLTALHRSRLMARTTPV